jgi:carbamate kinase
MTSKLALVAIGGNSLLRAGEAGTIGEQRANAAQTARHLIRLIRHGYQLVLTHGNGPQVGAQWLRSELAAPQISPEPLDIGPFYSAEGRAAFMPARRRPKCARSARSACGWRPRW